MSAVSLENMVTAMSQKPQHQPGDDLKPGASPAQPSPASLQANVFKLFKTNTKQNRSLV